MSAMKDADFSKFVLPAPGKRERDEAPPLAILPPPLSSAVKKSRYQLLELLTQKPVKGLAGMTRMFSVNVGAHLLYVHLDSGIHAGGVRLWTKCPRAGPGNHLPCFKWKQLSAFSSITAGCAWMAQWAARALDDSPGAGGPVCKSGHLAFVPLDADVAAVEASVICKFGRQ